MSKKIRVAILFGGKSAEHEVSLVSARNVAEALDKKKYDPVLVGIDKSGRWLPPSHSHSLIHQKPATEKLEALALMPEGQGALVSASGGSGRAIDVVFPILHGPFGEDGTVQGLLKLANVPFVGAGVLGSAVGMDKDVMKRLLKEAGIPVGKFRVIRAGEKPSFKSIAKELGLPLFIKPANLGSSVGVSKARDEKEFKAALKEAFRFDEKVIVEQFIKGREIECAVLGNDEPKASVPGEIIVHHDFYSYEAKYLDENGSSLEIPAKLPKAIQKRVQEIAIKTFKVLCCEGLARVDFFVTGAGKIYVNEINTMPGFTNISMFPKLWEASGIPYAKLIDELIMLAMERHQRHQQLRTSR